MSPIVPENEHYRAWILYTLYALSVVIRYIYVNYVNQEQGVSKNKNLGCSEIVRNYVKKRVIKGVCTMSIENKGCTNPVNANKGLTRKVTGLCTWFM